MDILITGTQRSGTTLLYAIINSLHEYLCVNEIYGIAKNNPKSFKHNRHTILRELESEIGFRLHSNAMSYPDLLRDLAKHVLTHSSSRYLCIKNPRLTSVLPLYKAEFPNAKILLIVRDPRAVCRSLLDFSTFRLGRPANAIAAAYRWKIEVQKQIEFAQTNKQNCLLIRYEQLVSEFQSEVNRIAKFIQVEDETPMLNYWGNQNLGTKIHEGNKNILLPPDVSLANRWQDELSHKDISYIESITHDELKNLGYSEFGNGSGPKFFEKVYALGIDKLREEIDWLRFKKKHRS